MRLLKVSLAGCLLTLLIAGSIIIGCHKNAIETTDSGSNTLSGKGPKNTCGQNYTCGDYQVTLDVDHTTLPGKTIFTWGITNPCPGNGNNGTVQNLSHWDFVPSQCLDDNWQDVLEASYNSGLGWQTITPTPFIQPDPSLKTGGCFGDDVFKFNQGTAGNATTFYRLVLLGNWSTGDLSVFFKSGSNTGCCSKTFTDKGIGCRIDPDCSFSQGYWFANNSQHPDGVHPWGGDGSGTVAIGGYTYTNAEGLAIWNASNQGGIKDAKKAFTQLAAIRLSGADEADPELATAVNTIECFLSGLGYKLTAGNLINQSAASKLACGNAANAAEAISDWINAHHCAGDVIPD
jgi:hypothetical protein